MSMTVINLTPHAVTIIGENNMHLVIEPSGIVARVAAKTENVGSITTDGFTIQLTATVFGQVENLPAPEDGTVFIVSSLVASRVPEREDVFIPNESVRDEKGRIIGCKSLGHI